MSRDEPERHSSLDRWARLTLLAVALILLVDLAQIGRRLRLPSEGWSLPLDLTTAEQRFVFASNVAGATSGLRPGDTLLAVEGQSIEQMVGRAFRMRPVPPTNWAVGNQVDYLVDRDGEQLIVRVPLVQRQALDWLRALAAYVPQSPFGFLQAPIGAFVFLRRPRNRAAQLLLLSGVLYLSFDLSATLSGQQGGPAELFAVGAYWPMMFFNFLIFPVLIVPLIPIFYLIFPVTKRPMRRRPALTLALALGMPPLLIFGRMLMVLERPLALWYTLFEVGPTLIFPASILTAAAALLHTLVTEKNPVLQAQTRWLVFGVLVGLGLGQGALFFLPELGLLPRLPAVEFLTIALGAVYPLALAIAILRYRLFDIDIIIKRTAVYGALSAALLATYFVSVALLQTATRGLTGQDSPLAIVASTLLIAALFNPLRGRIQTAINRRFFRGDYDAAQTLTSFGDSVRDEVDLASMQSALLDTVQRTMQPTQLSLWLRVEPARPTEDQ